MLPLRCGRRILVIAGEKPFEAVIEVVKGVIGMGVRHRR
jgi:hypothetical protein